MYYKLDKNGMVLAILFAGNLLLRIGIETESGFMHPVGPNRVSRAENDH